MLCSIALVCDMFRRRVLLTISRGDPAAHCIAALVRLELASPPAATLCVIPFSALCGCSVETPTTLVVLFEYSPLARHCVEDCGVARDETVSWTWLETA